jgi:hypothetical protein
MHVIQYLLVSAPTVEDATARAHEIATDASWSDWYEIGGRWNGTITENFPHLESALADPNILPVRDHPTEALSILDGIAKRQNGTFLEARDALAGNPVAISDVPGHIFGMPVADSAATARNMTERNAQYAREWQSMLSADSLVQAQSTAAPSLSLYYAARLIDMVEGRWQSDSAYFDSVAYSCHPAYLREAIAQSPEADPAYARQPLFLVAVDFHY